MLAWQKRGCFFLLLCALLILGGMIGAQAEGAQISGFVWLEKTVDGQFSGESGLSGARVILEQRTNQDATNAVKSIVTNASGNFDFSVAQAGEYRLRVELPVEYRFTIHGYDSDALPAQRNISYTPFFSLRDGQRLTLGVGATKVSSTVSVIAFEDENANGGRMLSEPVIRNVLAELLYDFDGVTYTIASATTNGDGEASLRDLSPGNYRLKVTLPGHYVVGPLGQKISQYYNCVLPDEGNTGYSDPFFLDARSSVGMGIGAVRTGALTGSVWYDQNFNGKKDDGEGGIPGAVITLYAPSLYLTRTAQPDANGDYSFDGLQPGDYQLEVQLPEGMIFTYPGTSMLSDATNRGTLFTSVQVDNTTRLGLVGAMPATGLNLTFYEDANLNGAWDAGESLLPGVSVNLSQGGRGLGTVSSDENGLASFPTLRGGETVVTCSLPEGFYFWPDAAAIFELEGAQRAAGVSLVLNGEAPIAEHQIGVTRAGSIQGRMFEDPANTGLYQAGYALLPGITIQAVEKERGVMQEALTDENGQYTLYPLLPGEYTVRFQLHDTYVAAPCVAPGMGSQIVSQTTAWGETDLISLAPGQGVDSVDGGVFRAGVIDGLVLLNENHDQLATNEGGMAGVTVTLLDEFGAPYSDFTYGVTDETGRFLIKGVLPGTYSLRYSLPEDSAFTYPMTEQTEYESDVFTTGSGTEIHMEPLGGVRTARLSGFVLHEGEPVAARLTMTSQTFGTVYETEAWEDGQYIFYDLRPDTYILEAEIPEMFVFGDQENSPLPPTAGSVATAELTFATGEMRTNANIRASLPGTLAGIVYYDENLSETMDGEEYGAEERHFSLWLGDREIVSVATDEAGRFDVGSLVPGNYMLRMELEESEVIVGAESVDGEWQLPVTVEDDARISNFSVPLMWYASVSGQVWSLDGTLNRVANIPVTLYDQLGNDLGTVLTDAQGAFTFTQLMPGEYSFSAILPEGFLFAREEDTLTRDSYIQSQPDGMPRFIPFYVPMGDDLSGLDIGMGANGSIGDRAWLDLDGNGMQDIGEPDMPGILIEIYQRGEFVASATTDLYGHYMLTDLYPGEYEMHVTMHSELKPTVRQTEFPLVASIMPESKETTVVVQGVVVPCGTANLHCDLGFQLRKAGAYPAIMDEIPSKDWRPYSERNP